MTTLTINTSIPSVADTTAPTLSSPSGVKVGSTGWTGSVVTDEGNGILYYLASTNASESKATLKASAALSVNSAGTRVVSGSGLTPNTTYYPHFLHVDAANNEAASVTTGASFTTDAIGAGSGTVTVSILGRSALQVAPDGVFFRASVSDSSVTEVTNRALYDPSWHDVTYIWDFGDPNAVSDKVVNLPAVHNDLNIAYGKEVGHVFTQPGTYSVSCTAYALDGTLIGIDTESVTVIDPDTVFTGTRTILVGSADAAYSGANVVASLSAARSAAEANSQTTRVLIQRGSTHNMSFTWANNSAVKNVYVSTYGTGARPVINSTAGFGCFAAVFSGFSDTVVQGLNIRGPYNPINETGSNTFAFEFFAADQGTNNRSHVIDDCVVYGFQGGVYTPKAVSGSPRTFVNNTTLDGIGQYCIFQLVGTDTTMFSATGCRMTHDELANSGFSGVIGIGNGQGPIRTRTGGRWHFDVLDLFSRQNWFANAQVPPDNGYQACIRYLTSMEGQSSAVFTRIAGEGGGPVFSNSESEGGSQLRPTNNCLIEFCLFVGSHHTNSIIELETVGFTVRNCLLVHPQKPARSGYYSEFIKAIKAFRPAASPSVPIKLYNNNGISNMTASQGGSPTNIFTGDTSKFTAVTNVNNVIIFPNQTSQQPEVPNVSLGNMQTVGGVWTPRYRGEKRAGVPLNTFRATPSGSVRDYRPNSGSPFVNTATGTKALLDFYLTVRSNADRGAVER